MEISAVFFNKMQLNVLINDVLHHIERRQEYLKAKASYLKLDGRIVVIDMIKGHPRAGHKDQPEMQISPDEATQWMAGAGLQLVEEPALFDNKFFQVSARNP